MSTQEPYGPVFAEVLAEERLSPLGPGQPNEKARAALQSLTVESAFAGQTVVDARMASATIAGAWMYHDYLDEAHRIVQNIPTPTGSYWHAIMHRRETDFSNSKYWFRKVGDHPVFAAVHTAATKCMREVDPREAAPSLLTSSGWDPMAFVDLCEACLRGRSPSETVARRIQQSEWASLFDFSYRKAIGR